MNVCKVILYVAVSITILFIGGCKKAGKEALEKVSKESVEKSGRFIVNESSELTLRTISKKELKNLEWKNLIKIIRKENINLAEALQHLDGSFQKKIGNAIKADYEFYNALISSKSVVDEYAVFTHNAPKAAEDINFFKYFTKCRDAERRNGVTDVMPNIKVSEELGIIKLLDKKSNNVICELRDGIVHLKEPFIDGSFVLKKTLIPNSIYKIKEQLELLKNA